MSTKKKKLICFSIIVNFLSPLHSILFNNFANYRVQECLELSFWWAYDIYIKKKRSSTWHTLHLLLFYEICWVPLQSLISIITWEYLHLWNLIWVGVGRSGKSFSTLCITSFWTAALSRSMLALPYCFVVWIEKVGNPEASEE